MDDARLFAVFAQCFGPADQDSWEQTVAPDSWQAFIARVRTLLQDGSTWGMTPSMAASMRRAVPLQEFLSVQEVEALYAPPDYPEKRRFSARHFTGGLPASALPVESLYVEWTDDPARGPFAHRKGLYGADTALYMRDVLESLGIGLPEQMSAAPDHLSIELDLVSVLLEAGCPLQARQLFIERSQWLTAYRPTLVELGQEALFYLALVDALLGMRAQQEARIGQRTHPADASP